MGSALFAGFSISFYLSVVAAPLFFILGNVGTFFTNSCLCGVFGVVGGCLAIASVSNVGGLLDNFGCVVCQRFTCCGLGLGFEGGYDFGLGASMVFQLAFLGSTTRGVKCYRAYSASIRRDDLWTFWSIFLASGFGLDGLEYYIVVGNKCFLGEGNFDGQGVAACHCEGAFVVGRYVQLRYGAYVDYRWTIFYGVGAYGLVFFVDSGSSDILGYGRCGYGGGYGVGNCQRGAGYLGAGRVWASSVRGAYLHHGAYYGRPYWGYAYYATCAVCQGDASQVVGFYSFVGGLCEWRCWGTTCSASGYHTRQEGHVASYYGAGWTYGYYVVYRECVQLFMSSPDRGRDYCAHCDYHWIYVRGCSTYYFRGYV